MKLEENERIDDLEYEGLKIIQNSEWFCFGIDSILLSDFAKEIKNKSKVLDIGTGTGIISILLSKKSKAEKIYGIEVQKDVAEMAKRSIKFNKLENKIEIIHDNIKNINKYLENNTIDAIVTNPPYKKELTGKININKNKLISRHEVECTLEDIIKISYKLLKPKGEFYMVHRTDRLSEIIFKLKKYRLEPKQIRFVYSDLQKESKMVLIKAVKDGKEFMKVDKPLIVYNNKGQYTDEILKIYNKEVEK
ncbi:MAG: tRNA1(Val) (adenine(37)-N6)-methyltransferase [Candidatus Scatovivens sp.]